LNEYLAITAITNNTENLKENKNTTMQNNGFPTLVYRSDYWTITARDPRTITAAVMKYARKEQDTLGQTIKKNTDFAKEPNVTPVLDKIQEYRRNWLERVNRMPRNRLPTVRENYRPTGERNQGRTLKGLLDV